MRRSILSLTLLLVGIMTVSTAYANPIEKPISMDSIQIVSTNIIQEVKKSDMLLWKQHSRTYPNGVISIVYEAVIVTDSTHHTVYVSMLKRPEGLPTFEGMSICTRPQGTISPDVLKNWSDDDFDGSVDRADSGYRKFDFSVDFDGRNAMQDMYQWRHNQAIRKLIAFFQME